MLGCPTRFSNLLLYCICIIVLPLASALLLPPMPWPCMRVLIWSLINYNPLISFLYIHLLITFIYLINSSPIHCIRIIRCLLTDELETQKARKFSENILIGWKIEWHIRGWKILKQDCINIQKIVADSRRLRVEGI